jgi:hypothetical protein
MRRSDAPVDRAAPAALSTQDSHWGSAMGCFWPSEKVQLLAIYRLSLSRHMRVAVAGGYMWWLGCR